MGQAKLLIFVKDLVTVARSSYGITKCGSYVIN